MKYTGRCLCGQLTFGSDADPVLQFNCHCRDCQRSTGSPYSPVMFFPRDAVAVSGEIRWYESVGGSGLPIRRGFCPHCGGQLIGDVAAAGPLLSVRAGALDDLSQYQPRADVCVAQAAPWDCMDPALRKFEGMPPRKA